MTELPEYRKSPEELARVQAARAMQERPAERQNLSGMQSRAPFWLVGLGYLLSLAFGLGLLVAGWIALAKPASRHHAALMTVLAVCTLLAWGLSVRHEERRLREEAAERLKESPPPESAELLGL
ncbi:MAG: hypothetical protein AAF555_04115 [Verrucomicrobiota bacterium]